MAALTITAAQVLPGTAPRETGIAGEAITQGQSVYFSSAGKWLKAQGDGTTIEAGALGYGIALTATGADGQPIVVARPGGTVTLGAGAAPASGVVYYVGDTAGGIHPVADIGSGDKVLPLCIGVGSNQVLILDDAYHAGAVLG